MVTVPQSKISGLAQNTLLYLHDKEKYQEKQRAITQNEAQRYIIQRVSTFVNKETGQVVKETSKHQLHYIVPKYYQQSYLEEQSQGKGITALGSSNPSIIEVDLNENSTSSQYIQYIEDLSKKINIMHRKQNVDKDLKRRLKIKKKIMDENPEIAKKLFSKANQISDSINKQMDKTSNQKSNSKNVSTNVSTENQSDLFQSTKTHFITQQGSLIGSSIEETDEEYEIETLNDKELLQKFLSKNQSRAEDILYLDSQGQKTQNQTQKLQTQKSIKCKTAGELEHGKTVDGSLSQQ